MGDGESGTKEGGKEGREGGSKERTGARENSGSQVQLFVL